MIVKIILAVPVVIAVLLILIGVFLHINRTRLGIQTVGVVTGISKLTKTHLKVKMDMESPIVKYSVKGQEYTCPSVKYQAEGITTYKKGQKINIRVSRRNPRVFAPVKSGSTAEVFLIFGGIFMIIAYIIMYIRYF